MSSSPTKVAYLTQLPEPLRATFAHYFDDAGVSRPELRSIPGKVSVYLAGYLLVSPDEAPLVPPTDPSPLPSDLEEAERAAVLDAIDAFLDAPSPEARAAIETYLETGTGRAAVDTATERATLLDARAQLRRGQAT